MSIQGIPNNKIEVLAVEEAKSEDAPHIIRLRVHKDYCPEAKETIPDYLWQWFHFTLEGKVGGKYELVIENADKAFVPDGWKNYKAKASYEGDNWFEVDETIYDGKKLTIAITLKQEKITFAYFRPFTLEQHEQLIALAKKPPTAAPACKVEKIGQSKEGRPINLVTLGEEKPGKLKIWIIAGQHPGETQGPWFVKGLIEALLQVQIKPNADAKPKSSLASASASVSDTKTEMKNETRPNSELLESIVFYIVPNMNPDGVAHGNLRLNSLGHNQNRCWNQFQEDVLQNSPEVYTVRAVMYEKGVDFLLDVHGDEASEKTFFHPTGFENQFVAETLRVLQKDFMRYLASQDATLDPNKRYPESTFSKAEWECMATYSIGKAFSCPAIVFEMPYKNWTADAAMQLGAKTVDVFAKVQPFLAKFRSQHQVTPPQLPWRPRRPACILM